MKRLRCFYGYLFIGACSLFFFLAPLLVAAAGPPPEDDGAKARDFRESQQPNLRHQPGALTIHGEKRTESEKVLRCGPSNQEAARYYPSSPEDFRVEILFSALLPEKRTSETGSGTSETGSGTSLMKIRIHHVGVPFRDTKNGKYKKEEQKEEPLVEPRGEGKAEEDVEEIFTRSLVLAELNSDDGIRLLCEDIQNESLSTPVAMLTFQQEPVTGFYYYNHVIHGFSIDSISPQNAVDLRLLTEAYSNLEHGGEGYDFYILSADGYFCGTVCQAYGDTEQGHKQDDYHQQQQQQPHQEHHHILLQRQLWEAINELLISRTEQVIDSFERFLDESSLEESIGTHSSKCTGTTTRRTKFSVTLVVMLLNKLGELLIDDDQQIIGSIFQASYESVNANNPSLCDPYSRIITQAKVFGQGTPEASIYNMDPYDSNLLAFGVTVVGSCEKCTGEGQAAPPRLFQSRFNEVVVVSTNTSLCITCPANVTQRLPTEEEFQTVFGAALVEAGILVDASDLKAIVPQTTVACGASRVPFTFRVLVGLEDFSANCTLPLSESDEVQLTDAFLRAYNRLVSVAFCDPYHRVLDDAFVVGQDSSVSEDGILKIELEVSGTLQCQDGTTGCDADEIGLYYDASAGVSSDMTGRNRHRELQNNVCGCPAYVVSHRGPSEPEVLVEFRSQVQLVLNDLACESMQVSQCEDTGKSFRSGLQLTFSNATAALQTSEAQIEASARTALLSIFGLDGNSTTCDQEFHFFENVLFFFGESRRSLENTIEFMPNDKSGKDGRILQDSSSPVPVPTPTTMDASFPPTSSSIPTSSFQGDTASQSPTALFTLTGNLIISGTCNGCSNELFASNQVNGRLLQREPEAASLEQSPRDLQNNPTTSSNCFCPIGSHVIDSKPSITRFETALEELLGLEILELLLFDVGEEGGLDATYSYACTDSMTSFRKNITVELQYTCLGETPTISLDEQTAIANAYVPAYNSQRDTVCDPFDIEISSARVIEVGELRLNGTSLPLALEVVVNCFGCDPLATDIYGFPDENGPMSPPESIRRLVQQQPPGLSSTRHRRMLPAGFCECDATLPRRPPSEAGVTAAMNPILQSLGLLCIGNCTECVFGAPFGTNMLLQVQFGEQDTLTGATNLQTAYTNALNGLVNGRNSTHCNPLFGVVTDSDFVFDLVYNSGAVGVNVTNIAGRNLHRHLQAVGGNLTLDLNNILSGVSVNLSEVPSSAPTTLFSPSDSSTKDPQGASSQNSTQWILLQASGVCNGCPTDLFAADQTNTRRGLDEEVSAEEADFSTISTGWFDSIYEHRSLQMLSSEELESESQCFCPLGSIIIQSNFDFSLFLESFLRELAKIDNQTTVITESVQVGVRQLACETELPFTSEFVFEFSAFEWVTQSLDDVQGLGNEIAAIYNSLVSEFCDEYFRNSISLTLDTTSVTRTNTPTNRRGEGVSRQLQQGCFNYQARFLVSGLCRGCASLGSPIPIFGQQKTSDGRSLEDIVFSVARDRWQRREVGSIALERQLQGDGTLICICDSSAVGHRDAPSLMAVQQNLQLLIPTQLPWQLYPSVCGLPVGTEIPCPVFPNTDSLVVKMTLYVQLTNGGCTTAVELDEIAQAYMDVFNEQMQQTHFTCEPSYLQISNVTADYSFLPICGRRTLLRKESRALLQDVTPVPLTLLVWGGIFSAGNMMNIVISESGSFNRAGAGVEVRMNGKYFILFDGSRSPSAFPSAFPSQFPSKFPSSFPSLLPSSAPSRQPSSAPLNGPTMQPSSKPSFAPTFKPSLKPSSNPTSSPSSVPTRKPSTEPSYQPSSKPTQCNVVYPIGIAGNAFRPWQTARVPALNPVLTRCGKVADSYDAFKYPTNTNLYLNVVAPGPISVEVLKVDDSTNAVCDTAVCPSSIGPCTNACCGPYPVLSTDIIMIGDWGANYRLHDGSAPCFDGTFFVASPLSSCSTGCTWSAMTKPCISGAPASAMWFECTNCLPNYMRFKTSGSSALTYTIYDAQNGLSCITLGNNFYRTGSFGGASSCSYAYVPRPNSNYIISIQGSAGNPFTLDLFNIPDGDPCLGASPKNIADCFGSGCIWDNPPADDNCVDNGAFVGAGYQWFYCTNCPSRLYFDAGDQFSAVVYNTPFGANAVTSPCPQQSELAWQIGFGPTPSGTLISVSSEIIIGIKAANNALAQAYFVDPF